MNLSTKGNSCYHFKKATLLKEKKQKNKKNTHTQKNQKSRFEKCAWIMKFFLQKQFTFVLLMHSKTIDRQKIKQTKNEERRFDKFYAWLIKIFPYMDFKFSFLWIHKTKEKNDHIWYFLLKWFKYFYKMNLTLLFECCLIRQPTKTDIINSVLEWIEIV